MLTKKHYDQIREELDSCKNPLFFFDDDPDGLCSFLLLYRYLKEGHGFVVKTHPNLNADYAKQIDAYSADKAFILDVANVDQDFIDASKAPVIWIDHHGPYQRNNVKYFNPRLINPDSNVPTTYMCYQVAKQDLWIAALGCIADYYMPDFIGEFREKYPELMNKQGKVSVGDLYFDSELGTLIKVFSFCLKGKTSDVTANMKVLTRINSPGEILNQETSQGKYLFRRFEKINNQYNELLKSAMEQAADSKVIVFTYSDDKMSFTGDLANELLYRFPGKIILVGRKKDEDIRMSIRSSNIQIRPILEKILVGLEGYGGGHELACGANVKEKDFGEFVKRLEESI